MVDSGNYGWKIFRVNSLTLSSQIVLVKDWVKNRRDSAELSHFNKLFAFQINVFLCFIINWFIFKLLKKKHDSPESPP